MLCSFPSESRSQNYRFSAGLFSFVSTAFVNHTVQLFFNKVYPYSPGGFGGSERSGPSRRSEGFGGWMRNPDPPEIWGDLSKWADHDG